MAMKAYACPRCLTLSSTTEDGDGGAHTCAPTPLVRDLEERITTLESWISKVLDEVPAKELPGDLNICILD